MYRDSGKQAGYTAQILGDPGQLQMGQGVTQ